MAERIDAPSRPAAGFCVCRTCGVHFDVRVRDERGVIITHRPTKNCPSHRNLRQVAEGAPSIERDTRFDVDPHAIAFVNEHPDGATLEDVSVALGLTRERVRQLEMLALRKLVDRLRLAGVSAEDVRDYFASRAEVTTRQAPRGPVSPPVRPAAAPVAVDPDSVVYAESPEVLGWCAELEAVAEIGEAIVRASGSYWSSITASETVADEVLCG